jgi:uncharacterized protein YbbC (DUF1343 family)
MQGINRGDLAEFIRHERKKDFDMHNIQIEKRRRGDYWDATGLTWINPSPNMRSLTQAVLYPGIGLLETTNLSVGRGTDTPFEVIGAPWIDGQRLAAELNRWSLPGVRFVPVRFTPTASKFANQPCQGVNIIVVNRQLFRPLDVGLQIATTLRKWYPHEWETKGLNRLLINQAVFDAIVAGTAADELKQLYHQQLDQFVARRKEFLLYSE